MECMCGNIIRGRLDPSLPFFSGGGSFWSNHTSALLAATSEEDRHGRTRNYCNSCGYESVALIPIPIQGERIGLLQLNDRRRGMLTESLVEYLGFSSTTASCHVGKTSIRAIQGIVTQNAFEKVALRRPPVPKVTLKIWGRRVVFRSLYFVDRLSSSSRGFERKTSGAALEGGGGSLCHRLPPHIILDLLLQDKAVSTHCDASHYLMISRASTSLCRRPGSSGPPSAGGRSWCGSSGPARLPEP